MNKFVTTAIL